RTFRVPTAEDFRASCAERRLERERLGCGAAKRRSSSKRRSGPPAQRPKTRRPPGIPSGLLMLRAVADCSDSLCESETHVAHTAHAAAATTGRHRLLLL